MNLFGPKIIKMNNIHSINMGENEKLIVCAFYKYVQINQSDEFVKQHLDFCIKLGIKGRILIGFEGINGSVCGNKKQIEEYKNKLRKNHLFENIDFKEQETKTQAFRKMFVRQRNEIVHSSLKADLNKTAKFIEPSEVNEMIENEDVVMLDVRNNYESRIGRFKNSVCLDIINFRDLPRSLNQISHLKDKKIITYCTGGIRCEKASAFLKENGFNDVYQIKGGILNYGIKFPDSHWIGNCFVFDDRIQVKINSKDDPLNECSWCSKKIDEYENCHNLNCDKLFVCCESCSEKYNHSCSETCIQSKERRRVPVHR